MASSSPSALDLPAEVLYLVIRFASSHPDLTLSIDHPRTTSTITLKQLLRAQATQADFVNKRLRFIYAGRVLEDTKSLYESLNLANIHYTSAPTGGHSAADKDSTKSSKAKGKQPVRDTDENISSTSAPSPPSWRIYIHCSVGDALTTVDLSAERASAEKADHTLLTALEASSSKDTDANRTSTKQPGTSGANTSAQTTPQGFDRLLASGFTPTDIAALRAQFMSNLAHTRTPDQMPSPTELRRMEERWLDNGSSFTSSTAHPSNLLGDTGFGAGDEEIDSEAAANEDLLWGNLVGFFWPLGALVWGFREEGVWSRRRQIAVFTGIMVNLAFGFVKLGG